MCLKNYSYFKLKSIVLYLAKFPERICLSNTRDS